MLIIFAKKNGRAINLKYSRTLTSIMKKCYPVGKEALCDDGSYAKVIYHGPERRRV